MLTKEQVEEINRNLDYYGHLPDVGKLAKTALTLYTELEKLKAERDNLQMALRSLKMRGEDGD